MSHRLATFLLVPLRALLPLTVTVACAGSDSADGAHKTDAPASPSRSIVDVVKADLTTPDRALRSYWRYKEEVARIDQELVRENQRSRRAADVHAQERILLGGDAREYSEHLRSHPYTAQTQSYEIVDVKQETESRASIMARLRNITPLDSGAVPDESDQKRRRDGSPVKYILEKDSTGWHVVQAQTTLLDDGNGEWRSQWRPNERYVPTYVTP